MVCVHLCPTLALATSPAGSGHGSQTLNINTNACSGCGLCVDGCDVGALSLRPLARPAPESTRAFPLQRATCGRCKVDFWQPAPVKRQSTQGPPVPNAGGAGQKNPICPTCVRGKPRWEQRVIQHQD
jgi:formate hydrogenlyase subunit 6/NADH:ubiquinone oxidoreductase subunit I